MSDVQEDECSKRKCCRCSGAGDRGNLARQWWGPELSSMLRQLVEELLGAVQLGQVAFDDDVAKDILVDAHLHVDFTQCLWAEGKVKLPDVGLNSSSSSQTDTQRQNDSDARIQTLCYQLIDVARLLAGRTAQCSRHSNVISPHQTCPERP